MKTIITRFTKLMGIQSPLVAAPMAFASTPELVAAVTASGGFGTFGAGFDSSQEIRNIFRSVREKLNIATNQPVPVGVGVIGWILDATEASEDPRLPTILAEMPEAIWFAFGDLGKYIQRVHEHNEKSSFKTKIFVMVGSAEDAVKAANEWKADVIVAQGVEAGGHGSSLALPVLTVVQSVISALGPRGPPVIAAGGISTGAQIAALLTLGADGVALGTRFLFTPECCYTDPKKDALLQADFHSTKRGLAFDDVGRTNGWPPFHDGRAIANKIWEDAQEGLSLEERIRRFDESAAKGEKDRLIVWAGIGTGFVSDIRPASDIFRELHEEAVQRLSAASLLVM